MIKNVPLKLDKSPLHPVLICLVLLVNIAGGRDPACVLSVDTELEVSRDKNIQSGARIADGNSDGNAGKQRRCTWVKTDETFSFCPEDSSYSYNHPQASNKHIKEGLFSELKSPVGSQANPLGLSEKDNKPYSVAPSYHAQWPTTLPYDPPYQMSCVHKHSDSSVMSNMKHTMETQPELAMYPTASAASHRWLLESTAKEPIPTCCYFSNLPTQSVTFMPEWGSNKNRSSLKLGHYDGHSSYEAFRKKFELVAQANGWDETEKVGQLAAALDGDAQQVLLDVQGSQVYSVHALHQALSRRFGDITPPRWPYGSSFRRAHVDQNSPLVCLWLTCDT